MNTLIERLADLPGIGKKTAQRLAFHIMKMRRDDALALSDAVREVKERVRACSSCFNLTETDPCPICADPRRDSASVCVVENPSDVNAVEKSGVYRGVYHVLGGALSPLDNIGPDDLHIAELTDRIREGVSEVIIATNPTVEGEATASYIADMLEDAEVAVTRIARGLPVGSDIELADAVTLARSFDGRSAVNREHDDSSFTNRMRKRT